MLKKLRRPSKDAFDTPPPRTDSGIEMPVATAQNALLRRLTFFDLPAELRNEIYEYVISDATLSLPCNIFSATISQKARLALRKRKPLPTANINGLLLASKQCRREYLSILLSTISVVVEIKDFHFEQLIRVTSSLNDIETNALRSNRNLTLLLDTRNCTTKDLASVRRWLDFRHKDDRANLPWKYEFPMIKHLPPSTIGCVRLMRELEYYADTISTLTVDVEEEQQDELAAIIEAFESRAMQLQDSIGAEGDRTISNARNVRGLAGGGLM